jgi:hypothetical protein
VCGRLIVGDRRSLPRGGVSEKPWLAAAKVAEDPGEEAPLLFHPIQWLRFVRLLAGFALPQPGERHVLLDGER